MKHDPREVLGRVKREKTVVLELESSQEADDLVDALYGLTEGISCTGRDGSPYVLTIHHIDLFD